MDQPSLRDREKRILDLLSHPAYSFKDPRKVVDQEMTICHLCLRDITNEDRSSISQTLNRILNDVARERAPARGASFPTLHNELMDFYAT